MVTVRRPTRAAEFALTALAGTVAAFALLRLSWIEAQIILPLTKVQAALAVMMFGTPALPVSVTLECSGADAIALCAGVVLAYPVPWRARFAGAAGGLTLILILNTFRIGTLGLAVSSPRAFEVLHLYVWPGVLTLAIAAYVFVFMRMADRHAAAHAAVASPHRHAPQPSRQFVILTAVFLGLSAATSPLLYESGVLLAAGGLIAREATAVLVTLGIEARATANVMITSRGAFVVTPECVTTPLIPVYLAAVAAYGGSWPRIAVGVLLTVPLFTWLGIARLLLVALPATLLSTPTFLAHAFYQLLLGVVVVYVAAAWRHGRQAAPVYAAAGLAAGLVFVLMLGPLYTRVVTPAFVAALDDPQGAIAFLPAFQAGLYLSLSIAALASARWAPIFTGFGVLALTQVTGLAVLQALAVAGLGAQVRDVRAWAVAGPVVIFATVMSHVRQAR